MRAPHSTEMLRASCRSAALEMAYAPSVSDPMNPAIELMMMTEPPPRSAICGMTMLDSQKLLRTLLAMTRSNASSGMSSDRP